MNPIEKYRRSERLTYRELANVLGLKSRGHAADLVSGRRALTVKVARRLSELTATPWHEFMDA